MKRELTCIGCPMGCRLTAEFNGTEVTEVTGNGCAVGARYAREELTNPKRMVTALVRVVGMELPLSVKTEAPIEKRLVFDCLAALGAEGSRVSPTWHPAHTRATPRERPYARFH